MKKIGILALIALFTMSFSVFAQPQQPNRNEQRGDRPGAPRVMNVTPEQRADYLTKQLNLTDTQKNQLVELYQKQDKIREENRAEREKQREQLMQERTKTREEYRAEREKELAIQDAELEKIIGKDKMDEHKKIRQQRMERMNENRRQRTEMGRRDGNKPMNDSVPSAGRNGKMKK